MKIILSLSLLLLFFSAELLISEEFAEGSLPPDEKLDRFAPVVADQIYVRFRSNSLPGKSLGQAYIYNESKLESILPAEASLTAKMNFDDKFILAAKNTKILELEEVLLRTFRVDVPEGIAPELYCKQLLAEDKNIELAEPIYVNESFSLPDDPRRNQQTVLVVSGLNELWSQGKLLGDTNVVICVIDNGVTQEHEDLRDNLAPNWGEIPGNWVDDDGNGYVDDFIGYNFSYVEDGEQAGRTHHSLPHGTGVAGVAAATTNNNLGIAGTGYKCRMYPLKTAKKNGSSIFYGFEGIMYAAVQGYDVINCSWGINKPYSDVEQSIIDYAVERGCAIVAAAGNDGDDRIVYPAGYRGVLGVGEVDATDQLTNISAYGSHVDIVAQGKKNVTTEYTIDYTSNTSGTSYSAPVIAGVVGLIRAEYPELSPMQALEYVRLSKVDIASQNPFYEDLVPGRLDVRKTQEFAPFSRPGIRPIEVNYYTDGQKVTRFEVGQEVDMEIDAMNYLGAAEHVRFELSTVEYFGDDVFEILNYDFEIAQLARESAFQIKNFQFRVKKESAFRSYLRVDILLKDEYFDFFLIPLIASGETTDLANNSIKFSVGDRSQIGYGGESDNRQGIGFSYKNYGNQMFKGGVMVSESNSRVVSSNFGYGPDRADFEAVKMHVFPDENIGIAADGRAVNDEKIGIEVKKEYTFPDPNLPMTRVKLTIKNTNDVSIQDVSAAYYLDWDVGKGNFLNTDSNYVELFENALHPSFSDKAAAVEIAGYSGNLEYPVFGIGVYTDEENAEAQAAGIDYNTTKNFTKVLQLGTLNSGTSIQVKGSLDISMVVGMKFLGEIAPGGEKVCYFCIGGGDNRDDFKENMRLCLDTLYTSVEDDLDNKELLIYPQPASDWIRIELSDKMIDDISMYDMLGNRVFIPLNLIGSEASIDLQNVSNGVYVLEVISLGKVFRESIIISR